MSLNLSHLAVFHAVADAGSVSRGAERLLVSQPAVSKQVKQLERAMNVALFERRPRGVVLTRPGEVLADYARRIFELADEAESAVGDVGALRRGTLRIGASPTIGTYLLPNVLVHFRRRFPGIRTEVEVGGSRLLRQRLEDDQLDFALAGEAVASPALESRTFANDALVAIAHPRHPLARRRRRGVTSAMLFAEPLVVVESDTFARGVIERLAAEGDRVPSPALVLDSTEAVKRAVTAGLGVAVVSRLAIETELAAKTLAILKLPRLSATRPLLHVWRIGRPESKPATAFLCILKHAIRGTLPKFPRSLAT
ncbi:MAG: LysR substrate-binding domain-containing protein [Tepidisphaeraceae bacterium]